jgi:hypothetical protein
MQFIFPPLIQAGLAAGRYEVVRSSGGVALGLARNKATGQFVGHAVGMLGNGGIPLNPVVAPFQLAEMYQIHRGFQAVQTGLQSIQASLGVLQTMTVLTGIGVAANLAISAVSLWQILKLREDVKLQRLEIREGFLDLKQVLKDQGEDIIQQIADAVDDMEFRQHRQALAQAYGRFLEATSLIKLSMSCEDLNIRNSDLANARQILTEALADYKNPHLLPESDVITKLRRSECTWAIEQIIVFTYQLQNQMEAASNCLGQLQDRICKNISEVIDTCELEDELEIIFPEIVRIHDQDLAILKLWQGQIDWVRALSPYEQKLLQNVDQNDFEPIQTSTLDADLTVVVTPPEQLLYESHKEKSHFLALRDTLRFLMQSEARKEYEIYVAQQAEQSGHKALITSNLEHMSDLSVANLYWFFYIKDEAGQEIEDETAVPV